jgi:ferredoxin-NADP reductase
MYPPLTFTLPFLKKKQIARNAYSFYFDRTKVAIDFYPGQYIRLTLPMPSTDGRDNWRYFTVASSPLRKEYLIITTKVGQSNFKKALFALSQNQKGAFFGPMGGFYLRKEDTSEKVYITNGIGITPFYSMITYVAEKKLQIPITLFVSFSIPEEMVYIDILTKIATENANIKVIYTITQPELSQQSWFGEIGRISKELIKKYVPDIQKPTYYITGSQKMVEEMEELLEKMGIGSEQVKVEQFTGY